MGWVARFNPESVGDLDRLRSYIMGAQTADPVGDPMVSAGYAVGQSSMDWVATEANDHRLGHTEAWRYNVVLAGADVVMSSPAGPADSSSRLTVNHRYTHEFRCAVATLEDPD